MHTCTHTHTRLPFLLTLTTALCSLRCSLSHSLSRFNCRVDCTAFHQPDRERAFSNARTHSLTGVSTFSHKLDPLWMPLSLTLTRNGKAARANVSFARGREIACAMGPLECHFHRSLAPGENAMAMDKPLTDQMPNRTPVRPALKRLKTISGGFVVLIWHLHK